MIFILLFILFAKQICLMSEQRMEDASPEPCTRQQRPSTVQQFLEEEATEERTTNENEQMSLQEANPLLQIAKPLKPNKKGKFELNATRLFLTYPQCNTPREVALMRLKEHFQDNLKGYLIAQELHKGEASLFK